MSNPKIPIRIRLPRHYKNTNIQQQGTITVTIDPKSTIKHLLEKILKILGLNINSPFFGLAQVQDGEYQFLTKRNKKVVKILQNGGLNGNNNLNNTLSKLKNDKNPGFNFVQSPENTLYFTIQFFAPHITFLSIDELPIYTDCLRDLLFYPQALGKSTEANIESVVEIASVNMRLELQQKQDSDGLINLDKIEPIIDVEPMHIVPGWRLTGELQDQILKTFYNLGFLKQSVARAQWRMVHLCIENLRYLQSHSYNCSKNGDILTVGFGGLKIFGSGGVMKFDFDWGKIAKLVVSKNGKRLDIFRDSPGINKNFSSSNNVVRFYTSNSKKMASVFDLLSRTNEMYNKYHVRLEHIKRRQNQQHHRELCIDDLINQNAQFQTKNQLNQRFSIAETLDNANYPVFNKNTILETSPMEIHPEIHSEIHQQIHPENTHHHSNQNSTSSAHKFDKMIAPRTATPITFENFTSSDQDNQDSDFVSVPTPRMQVCGTQSHQQPVFAKTPRIVRDAGIEINTDEDNLDDMSSGNNRSMISESTSSACSSYESSMSVDVTLDTLKNPKMKNPLGVKTIITSKNLTVRNPSFSSPLPEISGNSKVTTNSVNYTNTTNPNKKYNFQHSTPSKNELRKMASRIIPQSIQNSKNFVKNPNLKISPQNNSQIHQTKPQTIKLLSAPLPAPRKSILNSSVTSTDRPNIFRSTNQDNNLYRDSIRKICAGVVRNSSLRSSGGVNFRKPNPEVYRAIGTPLSTSFHDSTVKSGFYNNGYQNSTITSNNFNTLNSEGCNEVCFEILV